MTHSTSSFWGKVKIGDRGECWEWTGYTSKGKRNRKGHCYGRIDIFGVKGAYVHRVAYFLARPGKISLSIGKDDLEVCHTCDNPICCNPRHLYLGTHEDNMRDMALSSRAYCSQLLSVETPRAKLTADEVRAIRLKVKEGMQRIELAHLYDVSLSTIKGVLSRRHYADVI